MGLEEREDRTRVLSSNNKPIPISVCNLKKY